jgi:mRNA interferase RelE/StbE
VDKYAVEIKPSARKELDWLSDDLIGRLLPKIEALGGNPRPPGCKKLRGYKDHWRIRAGVFRIVYTIDDSRSAVSIAHRREVYE